MRIIITGASGFVGRDLCESLSDSEHEVLAVVRRPDTAPACSRAVVVSDIGPETDWTTILTGGGVVVHLAARVHQVRDKAPNPLAAYKRINTDGTLRLAREAVRAGVQRLLFVSSVKVNGESTNGRSPFREEELPQPSDPYGISKMEAEAGLHRLAEETGIEVVIVRPTLVYGPGVGANFMSLLNLVNHGWPLPLAGIHNSRSLVSVGNLIDLLATCVHHPAAKNEVFYASDGEDISTTDLVTRIARLMGKPNHLLRIPPDMLRGIASLVGRRAVIDRLIGSLQVDGAKARRVLGWQPPQTLDAGLAETVEWHLRRHRQTPMSQ